MLWNTGTLREVRESIWILWTCCNLAGGTVWGSIGPHGDSSTDSGDALNLAGILNTLDGVVDTPGRLLVMTSNHPEKLDPALIRCLDQKWHQERHCTLWVEFCSKLECKKYDVQSYEQRHLCLSCIESSCFKWIGTSWIWGPGRIDKMFHLNYMIGEQACKMIAHYFQQDCREQHSYFATQLFCGFAGVGFGNCCACFNCTGWVNIELNRFPSNVLMSAWDLTWGVCILLDANMDTQAVLPQSFLLDPTFVLSVTLVGPWDYSSTSGATLCGTWQSGGKSQETRNTTSLVFS